MDLQIERKLDGLHPCRTIDCPAYVAGQDYCPRCKEEIDSLPYPLGNVLRESRAFRWISCAIAVLAVALFVTLLVM
jgi:hypothetical protein